MRLLAFILLATLAYGSSAQFGFERQFDLPVSEGTPLKMPWVGGLNFCQFSNIDLDFDGVDDLFIFDRDDDKVLTFLQKGSSGVIDFEYAPEYESLFPSMRSWSLLRDYNCDGLPDIFTYTIGGCQVWKNVGNATDGHSFELASPLLTKTADGSGGYIYANSADIPAIVDVDGDGDMDFFQFGPLGTAVEYHRNMSVENFGDCDTLVYEMKNNCWGRFRETGSPTSVTLNDTLVYPCYGILMDPEMPPLGWDERDGGKGICILDLNDDGVMDMILGHQGGPYLIELHNEGPSPNMNSSMFQQFAYFPTETDSVYLSAQPAAYHVDINNDGERDILVSPAYIIGSNNHQSVYAYTNSNIDTEPILDYVQEDFLQAEMIENGSSSYPTFFDANGDGLLDLLVSSIYRSTSPTVSEKSMIMYYENVGTLASPSYELITEDWQGLSTIGIGASRGFYPTFADMDNDGDEDMILGEYLGNCHYFENTAGSGSPATFAAPYILEDNTATEIFDTQNTFPELVDLDRDGDYDLVIGRRVGKLRYFENVGTSSAFSFELMTNELGGVDVSEWFSSEGLATPKFLDIDGEYHLLVGSKTGYVHYYDDIDGNLEGMFNLVDSTLENLNIGENSALAIKNINDDTSFEMVVGTKRGGVGLFESAPLSMIGTEELIERPKLTIYPNPASDIIHLVLDRNDQNIDNLRFELRNLSGVLVESGELSAEKSSISVEKLSSGAYFLQLWADRHVFIEKVIID